MRGTSVQEGGIEGEEVVGTGEIIYRCLSSNGCGAETYEDSACGEEVGQLGMEDGPLWPRPRVFALSAFLA